MLTANKIWNQHLLISRIKQGFTLAEVLITLAIIGVIAVLTIPNLVYSIQQSQYSAQAKKTYSVLQQAYMSSLNEQGLDGFGAYSCASGKKKWAALTSKLNIIKTCNGSSAGNCWASDGVPGVTSVGCPKFWQENQDANSSFLTSDGTAVMLFGNAAGGYCDTILVDLNGPIKGPNQIGTDVIELMLQDTYIKMTSTCTASITNGDGRNYIIN